MTMFGFGRSHKPLEEAINLDRRLLKSKKAKIGENISYLEEANVKRVTR